MIAAIGFHNRRASRYVAESDGEPHAKTHYVTHTTRHYRKDCTTRDEARRLAKALNLTEAEARDGRARVVIRDIAFLVRMDREADALRLLDQYSLDRYTT